MKQDYHRFLNRDIRLKCQHLVYTVNDVKCICFQCVLYFEWHCVDDVGEHINEARINVRSPNVRWFQCPVWWFQPRIVVTFSKHETQHF